MIGKRENEDFKGWVSLNILLCVVLCGAVSLDRVVSE
jgi:hypothetical protein